MLFKGDQGQRGKVGEFGPKGAQVWTIIAAFLDLVNYMIKEYIIVREYIIIQLLTDW